MKLSDLIQDQESNLQAFIQDQESNLQAFIQDWKLVIHSLYFQSFEDISLDNLSVCLVKQESDFYIELTLNIAENIPVVLQSFPVKPIHRSYADIDAYARRFAFSVKNYTNSKLLTPKPHRHVTRQTLYNKDWYVEIGLLTANQEIEPYTISAFLYKLTQLNNYS